MQSSKSSTTLSHTMPLDTL